MSEQAVAVYQPKQRNAMMIKNLCPGLMEMGKIKIGNKGAVRKSATGSEWQAPQKLDHFLITTNERGKDNNLIVDETLHKLFGDAPKSIPVRLIYDDISLNFATRYICYYGKTVFCSGDGEEAQRLQADKKTYATRSCPCERQDPKFAGDVVDGKVKAGQGKCKINGILSVIIDGAQSVGGVWKFRTTSYNSVVGILSSLALIQRITGGRLAGIPMNMTVSPKTVQDPIQGNQQTIYVVGLQYAGTMDTLRDTGYQIALTEAKHGISMQRIEEDARLMLTHTPATGLGDDLTDDVIAEFYPEEAEAEMVSLVAPQVAAAAEVVDTTTGEITAPPKQQKPAKQAKKPVEPVTVEPAAVEPAVSEPVVDAVIEQEPQAPVDLVEPVTVEETEPPHPANDDDGWSEPPGGESGGGDLF